MSNVPQSPWSGPEWSDDQCPDCILVVLPITAHLHCPQDMSTAWLWCSTTNCKMSYTTILIILEEATSIKLYTNVVRCHHRSVLISSSELSHCPLIFISCNVCKYQIYKLKSKCIFQPPTSTFLCSPPQNIAGRIRIIWMMEMNYLTRLCTQGCQIIGYPHWVFSLNSCLRLLQELMAKLSSTLR